MPSPLRSKTRDLPVGLTADTAPEHVVSTQLIDDTASTPSLSPTSSSSSREDHADTRASRFSNQAAHAIFLKAIIALEESVYQMADAAETVEILTYLDASSVDGDHTANFLTRRRVVIFCQERLHEAREKVNQAKRVMGSAVERDVAEQGFARFGLAMQRVLRVLPGSAQHTSNIHTI